jgi:formiminoglutamase
MKSSPKAKSLDWSWISIPDHQGVVNVGGRIGAAQGPAAAWELFRKLKGRSPVHGALRGAVTVQPITPRIEDNHRLATQMVEEQALQSAFTVVVGGGHDLGYPHLAGIQKALTQKLGRTARLGCINLDAHLDVRKPSPAITSGSPFYLALESGVIQPADFIEFGIQSHCNGPELWTYIDEKKVEVIDFAQLRDAAVAIDLFRGALARLTQTCDGVAISLDLDCIEQSAAPGVSAPQAEGFRVSDIIRALEEAGREPKVCSLGIFELNPLFDRDGQTARIAATAAWHFAEAKLKTSQAD